MVENQRATRVRTGCRQCRTRRRKCDEEKPKCRNCTARGTSCEYAPLLTFLSKNAYTVRQPSKRPGPSRVSNGNEEVHFINLSSPTISNKYKPSASHTNNKDNTELPTREDISSTAQHFEANQNSGDENTGFYQYCDEKTPAANEHVKQNGTKGKSPVVSPLPREPAEVDRRPSDGHRSAVQGLLALGLVTSAASPSLASADLSPSRVLSSPSGIDGWNLSAGHIDSRQERPSGFSKHSLDLKSFSSLSSQYQTPGDNELAVKNLVHEPSELIHSANNQIPTPTPEGGQLEEWRKVQLLRHYRYEVATWLDICDANQSFGIAATQLALGKAPFGPPYNSAALSTILSLAEISHSRLTTSIKFFDHMSPRLSVFKNSTPTPILEQRGSIIEHLTPGNSDLQMNKNAISSALCASLEKVKHIISNIHYAWTQSGASVDHLDLVGSLVQYAPEKSLRSAIYWLLLRLDLSASLINPTANIAAISMSFTLRTDDLKNNEDLGHRTFQYAHIPLVLCAQAIVLCDGNANGTTNATESWMRLVHKLDEWYLGRPSEFRSMLEIDPQSENDSNFPVLLFTNGAGIFGNQLYHTAMHLLLQKKPRTANLVHLTPATRSFLWHTRRICGMAIHNDRRQCWDLTLLASFFVAATSMTYQTQQMEIVQGFHRIQDITGFNVGDLVAALQLKWSTMEDVWP